MARSKEDRFPVTAGLVGAQSDVFFSRFEMIESAGTRVCVDSRFLPHGPAWHSMEHLLAMRGNLFILKTPGHQGRYFDRQLSTSG